MPDRLLVPKKHAIAILMIDHDSVKDLFERFEEANSAAVKERIIRQAVNELKIHAVVENEIFYPAVMGQEGVGGQGVAKVLLAELDRDSARDGKQA